MKRAHVTFLNMLSISAFIIITCGILGSVWWACIDDQNET